MVRKATKGAKKGGRNHEWKKKGRGHSKMYKEYCTVMRKSGMMNDSAGRWIDASGDQESFKARGLNLW